MSSLGGIKRFGHCIAGTAAIGVVEKNTSSVDSSEMLETLISSERRGKRQVYTTHGREKGEMIASMCETRFRSRTYETNREGRCFERVAVYYSPHFLCPCIAVYT